MPPKNIFAIIEQEPGHAKGLIFPDFPGIVAACDDLKQIHIACNEALDLHFEGRSDEYIRDLEVKSLEQVLADQEYLELRLKGAIIYCMEYYFDSRDIRK